MPSRNAAALGQGPLLERAHALLQLVTGLLEARAVPYHLEGGTLLGLVRDGALLPWDHDLDLSVPAESAQRLEHEVLPVLRWRHGLRISTRRMEALSPAWQRGAARLFKVRPRRWLLLRGEPCLDIFVKHRAQGHAWWEAEKTVMRVPERFYDGFDLIPYAGRSLRTPRDAAGYLELKYGNWRVPVKDWKCSRDEKTIVARADEMRGN